MSNTIPRRSGHRRSRWRGSALPRRRSRGGRRRPSASRTSADTILWTRATGKPVANAIVLAEPASRHPLCDALKAGPRRTFPRAHGPRGGRLLLRNEGKYLLDTIPGLRARAEAGEILSDGRHVPDLAAHRARSAMVTDASNSSRTLMFDIHRMDWYDELLRLLDGPQARCCPGDGLERRVRETVPSLFGAAIPISGKPATTAGHSLDRHALTGQRQEHVRTGASCSSTRAPHPCAVPATDC